ncbi:MAG: response regulator [Chloroflexi bacterium]|nr:response regulator [Chloroflexota bacterium]
MSNAPMAARHVLIVDDDLDHVVIARTVIQGIAPALPVETCMDARAAEQRIVTAPGSAIVFVDRMLGGTESIPLIEQAMSLRPDLYLVLMSSSLSADDRTRALTAGAIEAIEKPANLHEWRNLVKGILVRAGGRVSRARPENLVG